MTMMHLSRNIAHVALLLVVVATNNVVQVQAVCAIDAECEYGTSCLTFDVQLRCNAPSDAVTGIFIQRFVDVPTTPLASSGNTAPTPMPTFPSPPSPTTPATTPTTLPPTNAPVTTPAVTPVTPNTLPLTNAPVTAATNPPTFPSTPCVGNGIGQTCYTVEKPNIACCFSTINGAVFNACCSSDFGGLGITETNIDGFGAACRVTGSGCLTTNVAGNEVNQELDFSDSGAPCKKVSEDPTCSNKQDDPTKNYGTCTNNGVTFDVCCPPDATGTYAIGDSCAVSVPGRLPSTGAPTISLAEPTEFTEAPPSNPSTDAPVVPAAPKACSAYESCRNANLQGDCCPTIDGQFLGCCEGVDIDSPTTNALEPIIMDPTDAPESFTVLPESINMDPTDAPESFTVLPEPIVSNETDAPTTWSTWSTTWQDTAVLSNLPESTSDQTNDDPAVLSGLPESTSDQTNDDPTALPDATIQPTLALFPASEILTKKPATIPAATVPPTETNLRGEFAVSALEAEATSSAHTTSMMSKSFLSILLAMIIGASAL